MTDNSIPRGYALLNNPALNVSTAFVAEEREAYGLRGLLPHVTSSLDGQINRVLENMRRKAFDIERYIFLSALQDRNERLFYRTVIDHIEEVMPLIYTPTVGQACKEFAHIFRTPKGFYITPDDRGDIRKILENWPKDDVRVIVVTDGQRILGLGDLGANGMGIPIGKLSLYVACAGIRPDQCLPVMLDVGTNNEDLLDDPLYLGYPKTRAEADEYFELVDEFVMAIQDKYPRALIQFEDFLTPNAFELLERYQNRVLCFNDDIQGTAAVALAGVYASTRISQLNFGDLRIMFLGAGSAATGIGNLFVSAFMAEGLEEDAAHERLWFVDKKGLVTAGRDDLMSHSLPYAHKSDPMTFVEAINKIKPHVLIGATGAPGTFTKEVVEAMCDSTPRPTIFALSNPTALAECTAEQAYQWSNAAAIFASGSPFEPVVFDGKILTPGQGNNAYIFPGVGLGAIAVEAERITSEMFLAAARVTAEMVSEADLEAGTVYPPLSTIRDISLEIAVAVANVVCQLGLNRRPMPDDAKSFIQSLMYDPRY